jgi:hypothetical protein
LNDSIIRFEQVYAHHRERVIYPNVLDDNALAEVLQQTLKSEDIFSNAAVLEKRINSMLILQAECNDERTTRRSNCLYVAKLLPLVKLITDIGGFAAQVRFSFFDLLLMIFRLLDAFLLPLLYEELF